MSAKHERKLQVAFSEFQGLDEFLRNSNLREITLGSVGQDKFIATASETIFSQFLLRTHYHEEYVEDTLEKLKRKGYTSREISIAIAEAVLEQRTFIRLSHDSFFTRYTKTTYLVGFSTFLSLLTLLVLLYFGRQMSERAAMGLLQFEPILAFFGVLFGVIYFWILKKILRR